MAKATPKSYAVQRKTGKRKREEEDQSSLDKRVSEINTSQDSFTNFADLPLCSATARGIEASHFRKLTDIQARAIPSALQGRDILGAAQTGSGKTLAFLVPVLEQLHRKRWTEYDGLGALILSPTRELAIQIFDVLRKIGRHHSFSAGLVIGGKNLQEEQERLGRMNILVCTPGRILQHMDQTSSFDTQSLQLLVLDEADRIMDMGFQSSVDAIIEHLPKERQTLLFSATQTKKVSDLARLSLKNPEYVSVHEAAQSATPANLQQNYIVSPLSEKLDTLWSFIRSNLKSKILVFMSSGKQVRFVYETFRHMQPGISLLHIHGRQKQIARLQTITNFSSSQHSCLFSTDVAARGLDVPAVDWVVQLDCPEDAETYIHRVGRTARYERNGRAVLFLDPSEEEGMLERLEKKKVSVEKINVRQKKQQSVKSQLQNMCFKDPELKYLGQKAFVSYVKSIHLQKDKQVFKLGELPLEDFAASLGLPGAPKIKFQSGESSHAFKNRPRQLANDHTKDDDAESDDANTKKKAIRTRYDRMFERQNQDILTDHYTKLIDEDKAGKKDASAGVGPSDDFLSVRRRIDPDQPDTSDEDLSGLSSEDEIPDSSRYITGIGKDTVLIDSKRKEKLLTSKKKLLKLKHRGSKVVFGEDGNAHDLYELENEEQFRSRGSADTQKARFIDQEQQRLQTADLVDKQTVKAKRKEKRERRRLREEAERNGDAGSISRQAILQPVEGDDGEDLDKLDLLQAEEESAPASKKKKWFQQSSEEEEDRTRKDSRNYTEPESLEDLEAVASGLLG